MKLPLLVAFAIIFAFESSAAHGWPSKEFKLVNLLPPDTELLTYSKQPYFNMTDDAAIINQRVDFMNKGIVGLLPGKSHLIFGKWLFEEPVSHHVVAYSGDSKTITGKHPLFHMIVFQNDFSNQFREALSKAKCERLNVQRHTVFNILDIRSTNIYISLVDQNKLLVSEDFRFLEKVIQRFVSGSNTSELPFLQKGLSKFPDSVEFLAIRHFENGSKPIANATTGDASASEIAIGSRDVNKVRLFYCSKNHKYASNLDDWLTVDGIKSDLTRMNQGWAIDFDGSKIHLSGPDRDLDRRNKIGIRKSRKFWHRAYSLLLQ